MENKLSIKESYILYDKDSSGDDISDILLRRFEDPSILDKTIDDLHDPYLLADMDKAVARIKLAKEQDEK